MRRWSWLTLEPSACGSRGVHRGLLLGAVAMACWPVAHAPQRAGLGLAPKEDAGANVAVPARVACDAASNVGLPLTRGLLQGHRLLQRLGRLGQGAARAACFAAHAGPVGMKHGFLGVPHRVVAHFREMIPIQPPVLAQQANGLGIFAKANLQAGADFFLFIKDYGWGLRYHASWPAGIGLDLGKPLQLDWVKLRRPLADPSALLQATSDQIFDWNVIQAPRHKGFEYQVAAATSAGAEAVINFLKDMNLSLWIQKGEGIKLLSPGDSSKAQEVTHAWVQCKSLPFNPSVQSVSFYHLHQVVTQWHAAS